MNAAPCSPAGSSPSRRPRAGGSGSWLLVALFLAGLAASPVAARQDAWDVVSAPPRVLRGEAASAEETAPVTLVPVPMSVLAVPLLAESGHPYVSIVVEMGGAELLQSATGGELQGTVEIEARDSEGASRDRLQQPFRLPLDAATRDRLESTGLKLFGSLRLPPGEYRLIAAVRAGELGAEGSRTLALTVPDFYGPGSSVSPPLVPHELDRWKAFQQSEGGHSDLEYPFVTPAGEAFMPSARPVVDSSSPLTFYILAYGVGDEGDLRARIVDPGGGTVAVLPLAVESRAPGVRAGEERFRARVDTTGIPAGSHALELAIADARAVVPIEVLALEPDMLAESGGEEPAELVEEKSIDPREVARLEERYGAIVAGLAPDRFETSARDLTSFERAVLRSDDVRRDRALRALRKAQLRVAKRLAGQVPEGLWPVIYLHFLADDLYRAEGATWWVAHNRVFVVELVDLYSDRRGDESVRRGAQLLATLGVPAAALERDGENALALLRIALGREKSGSYSAAVPLFERIVRSRPDDLHGRLRLGVNLRRVRETDRARNLLEGVARSEAPTWMRIVAYQELADLEMDRGSAFRAEAVFREGIERLAEDQSLLLGLSFVLEQQRRRDDAIAVLNRLSTDRGSDEPSARHRYNGQPAEELGRARRELRAHARASLPSLHAAVGVADAPRTESSP